MQIKEILSLQHPIVKHLVKLRKERKYRMSCKSLFIEGKKLIEEIGPALFVIFHRGLISSDKLFPMWRGI